MDYTQNLHLPQWEASDRIMRTDFNDAMAAIDAALAAGTKVAVSSYNGEASGLPYNGYQKKDISLPFRPKVLFVIGGSLGDAYSILFFDGMTRNAPSGEPICRITDTGFTVASAKHREDECYPQLNNYNYEYRYLAIG